MRDKNIVTVIWVSFVGFVVALLMALAPGCATVAPVPSGATCETVCLHGHNLGCAWATHSPAGATCEDVCTNAQRGPLPWNLSCTVSAADCAAADACNR
jgi:hypothetical protein